jgi:hypothetical protein
MGISARRSGIHWWNLLIILALGCLSTGTPGSIRLTANASPPSDQTDSISASEFSRLIREFSEDDGYFRSDNFTSNETSYLHVVDRLRDLRISNGAYIGVGPEQNFTYIAKIRPKIAFIVDIRRQAMIQHLLYKAVFHQAQSRAQFLELLLSRPLKGRLASSSRADIADLVDYFSRVGAPDDVFDRNLSLIKRMIRQEFRFPLDAADEARLEYVYGSFRANGLAISFQFGNMRWYRHRNWFPSLADLLLETDRGGRLENFLVSDDDYRFVRQLHLQNRIIPVVGDFAGTKALSSIAAYLVKNGYKVTAFYTSNVEQYLFQGDLYGRFLDNIRLLPINERSVIIRAVVRLGVDHPAHMPGHGTTTLLQQIAGFLRDQKQGPYPDYWEMVTHHYLAP